MIWKLRWHVTNLLFSFGMWIAPRGRARDLLWHHLCEFAGDIGEEVGLKIQLVCEHDLPCDENGECEIDRINRESLEDVRNGPA